MRHPRSRLLIVAVMCLLVAGGCGSDGSVGSTAAGPAPNASPEDFPSAAGKTLEGLVQGMPAGPVLSLAVSALGRERVNRFTFSLLDRARQQLRGVQVALYTADPQGTRLSGPYTVRSIPLTVKDAFESRSAEEQHDAIASIYRAALRFPRAGPREVVALLRLDGRLVASRPVLVRVGGADPPDIGERAPRIDTPTLAEVGDRIASIDTRIPPTTMHSVDYADVVGRRPVVLVFASPGACPSGYCASVLDALEEVKAQTGSRVAFVHMEARERQAKGWTWRPQAQVFRLHTQPWVFAVDRRGRVAARIEGPASVAELGAAVKAALGR